MYEIMMVKFPYYHGHTGINIEGWDGKALTKTGRVEQDGTDWHFYKDAVTNSLRIPNGGTLQIGDNSVDISIGITFTYKEFASSENLYAIPWSKARQGANPFGIQSVILANGYFGIQDNISNIWINRQFAKGQRITIDAIRKNGVFELYFNGVFLTSWKPTVNSVTTHDWVLGSYLGFENEILTSSVATPTEWILHGFEVKRI